jgi:hypothetical protein
LRRGGYKSGMSAKEITSLLLFAVAKAGVALPHIARLKETVKLGQYGHPVPPLLEQNYADGDIKWMFDFSSQLSDEINHQALENFLQSHERFILDVVHVDSDFTTSIRPTEHRRRSGLLRRFCPKNSGQA